MDKFQDKTLFFYGTLRSREVREAVLDQQANNLILIDAYIKGYKLFKVKNTNYPLIISDPLSKNRIVGFLVYGINSEIRNKLDLFEGDNYSRFNTYAYKVNEKLKIKTEIYMPNKPLEYLDEWIFDDWYKFNKKKFFEEDFNKNGILSPKQFS